MPKKKHTTPNHLDYLFTRNVIRKRDYKEYWEGYWNESPSRRARYNDRFVSDLQLRLPVAIRRRSAGTITFSKKAAEEQARNIQGYVARVTKTGRRSKHGKFYRAFPKGKKNVSAK